MLPLSLIHIFTYNAENRPVKFESEDGGPTVECAYDSMGRRFEKKVTVGGTTGFHARYLLSLIHI